VLLNGYVFLWRAGYSIHTTRILANDPSERGSRCVLEPTINQLQEKTIPSCLTLETSIQSR
jgi:hypothetical protein